MLTTVKVYAYYTVKIRKNKLKKKSNGLSVLDPHLLCEHSGACIVTLSLVLSENRML